MDSAWAAQHEPSSGTSRTPPAGSTPLHRHRSTVHRHPAAHPPSTATPHRSGRSDADRSGRERRWLPSSMRTAPPAKVLSWALEHPRCGLRREGHLQRRPSGPDVTAAGFRPSGRTTPLLRPPSQRTTSAPFRPRSRLAGDCCRSRPCSRTRTPVAASSSKATGNTPASVLHPTRLPPEGRKNALAPSDWNEALRQGRSRRASPGPWDSCRLTSHPKEGRTLHAASRPKEATGKPRLLPQGRTPPPLRPPAGSEHPAGLPPKGPTPPLHVASKPNGRTRRHPSGSDQGHPSTASRAEPPHQ